MFDTSKKYLIYSISFLVVVALVLAFYLYIQNKNLAQISAQRNLGQSGAGDLNKIPDTTSSQEVFKELNSFITVNNTTNTSNTQKSSVSSIDLKASAKVSKQLSSLKTPKTLSETDVLKQLSSMKN
jgi:hypothetical protein